MFHIIMQKLLTARLRAAQCGILLNGSDNMAGEQVPAQPDIKKVVGGSYRASLSQFSIPWQKWMSALVRSRDRKVLNESDTKRQEAEAKVLDDRRKGAFKKQLNAANAAKIDEHWTQAKTVGESLYLDEHPEIRQITKADELCSGGPDQHARSRNAGRRRQAEDGRSTARGTEG